MTTDEQIEKKIKESVDMSAELKSRLADFGREMLDFMLDRGIWGDEDGDALLEVAKRHGFAEYCPYDPEKHGEDIEADAGDEIWYMSKEMWTTIPDPVLPADNEL